MSARVVSLTGATGFIGSVLRERLVARGVEVRALARSRSGTAGDGTQWIRGTLEDELALAELTRGRMQSFTAQARSGAETPETSTWSMCRAASA